MYLTYAKRTDDGCWPEFLKILEVGARVASIGVGCVDALGGKVVELFKICVP